MTNKKLSLIDLFLFPIVLAVALLGLFLYFNNESGPSKATQSPVTRPQISSDQITQAQLNNGYPSPRGPDIRGGHLLADKQPEDFDRAGVIEAAKQFLSIYQRADFAAYKEFYTASGRPGVPVRPGFKVDPKTQWRKLDPDNPVELTPEQFAAACGYFNEGAGLLWDDVKVTATFFRGKTVVTARPVFDSPVPMFGADGGIYKSHWETSSSINFEADENDRAFIDIPVRDLKDSRSPSSVDPDKNLIRLFFSKGPNTGGKWMPYMAEQAGPSNSGSGCFLRLHF